MCSIIRSFKWSHVVCKLVLMSRLAHFHSWSLKAIPGCTFLKLPCRCLTKNLFWTLGIKSSIASTKHCEIPTKKRLLKCRKTKMQFILSICYECPFLLFIHLQVINEQVNKPCPGCSIFYFNHSNCCRVKGVVRVYTNSRKQNPWMRSPQVKPIKPYYFPTSTQKPSLKAPKHI